MTFAVEEYDDDAAVGRLAWLAQDDHTALNQACDVCLSYTEIDLAIRGRAIGLLARVRYGDLAPSATSPATAWGAVKRGQEQHDQDDRAQRE
jgi:hypothetical protein